MPFQKRIVEPRSLSRINRERLEVNSDVFASLDAVNCQTLINILRQLSDLSRHASSMFAEIQTESALVINKASALQHRLDSLQDTRFPAMLSPPKKTMGVFTGPASRTKPKRATPTHSSEFVCRGKACRNQMLVRPL
ncbi:hypothetical protein QQF64_011600 [Cirrhinus molitorella]|uniref:Uncharacterized protein n=1 Tax=Cirrhinus molitorella TaxID=172907 RepID=A0ABR3M2A3_9TELE